MPQIAGGDFHVIALKADGTIWAWGLNAYGQIGDGTTVDRHSPVLIGSGYTAVTAGRYHSLAVKADGSLWAWGFNEDGQLGDGSTTNRAAPVKVGDGFSKVAAGIVFSLALKADGSLWSWGTNLAGALGDGTEYEWRPGIILKEVLFPAEIGSGYTAIWAGNYHALALKTDGALWAWGLNDLGQLGLGTDLDPLGFGNGTDNFRASPALVGSGYVVAVAGEYYSLALKADSTLWSWGENFQGQLGDGSTMSRSSPGLVGSGYSAVSVGAHQTIALKADGSLWAWGSNAWGQLGDGTTIDHLLPNRIDDGFTQLSNSVSNNYTLALKQDGALWAWGTNVYGLLGDGTTTNRLTPAPTGFNVYPSSGLVAQASASGPLTRQTIGVDLAPTSADAGQTGHTFVAALLPDNSIHTLGSSGWTAYDPNSPVSYSNGPLQALTATLVTNTDLSTIAGTAIFLGYGLGNTSQAALKDMLKRNLLIQAYRVQ